VVIGAHTDSPCPRLKPCTKSAAAGFLQVRVQPYGGGLWRGIAPSH
jgi:aspartyl aminopeptidase